MTDQDNSVNKKPGAYREAIPQVCTGSYHDI